MDAEETRVYIAILIVVLLLTIMLAFFIMSIIRNQRRRIKSHNERMLQEVALLETERSRVSSDLHDQLSPMLSVIKLQLECLESPTNSDKEIIEKINCYIDDTIQKVREISNNVIPHALKSYGLKTALDEYIDIINGTHKICIDFRMAMGGEQIPQNMEIHLYRIVQEIVSNAARHSKAETISVVIYMDNSFLHIKIKDDGRGFDQGLIATNSKGAGLRNIMARVDILRGKIYLNTCIGNGTEYQIEIPLK
jgi:signal transduction histidine kinase